jgi:hypothetical protein
VRHRHVRGTLHPAGTETPDPRTFVSEAHRGEAAQKPDCGEAAQKPDCQGSAFAGRFQEAPETFRSSRTS